MLNKDIKRCLVIEDAPAGIKSGIAAGAEAMACCTSHTREQVEGLGARFVVHRLDEVRVEWVGERMRVVVG
jgi:glycerol 3-phosphatase-1